MVIAQSRALILTASATFFEDVRHLVEPETFDLDFATVADVTSHVENGPTVSKNSVCARIRQESLIYMS